MKGHGMNDVEQVALVGMHEGLLQKIAHVHLCSLDEVGKSY